MHRHGFGLLLWVVLGMACWAQTPGRIETVAGSATPYATGTPALNARLAYLGRLTVDTTGNVIAVDNRYHIVFSISPGGIFTLLAGTGIHGYSGENVPATIASFGAIAGVAVDVSNRIYTGEGTRVRQFSANGMIATVAGGDQAGSLGDGGAATSAAFAVCDIAADAAGNLYIADCFNNRIRRVTPAGIISTIAGNGISRDSGDGGPATSASLFGPSSLALDGSGNIYVFTLGNRLRRISANGTITTLAGNGSFGSGGDGGPATAASLTFGDLAVDGAGNVYLSQPYFHRIRKVDASGIISTVAGTGTPGFSNDGGLATGAMLNYPGSLAVDREGSLYVGDSGNYRIRKIDRQGVIATIAGSGAKPPGPADGVRATEAVLFAPAGLAISPGGDLYFAELGQDLVRKVSAAGTVSIIAGSGEDSGEGGPATQARMSRPSGVAVDSTGSLYIAVFSDSTLKKVSANGTITTAAGGGGGADGGPANTASVRGPTGIAVDPDGSIFFAETKGHRVRKIDGRGIISTVAGNGSAGFGGDGGPAVQASLRNPTGVWRDAAGTLYIADSGNHRVRRVTSNGVITTIAGNGQQGYSGDRGPATAASLYGPIGIAGDAAGNLYVADTGNHCIRRISPSGIISTIAGDGVEGLTGDGGLASQARLRAPSGLAFSGDGYLYISDTGNNRIRRIFSPADTGFEARLTRLLQPGFYILEATLDPGAQPGFWGLEVLTSLGQAVGGFNLGGGVEGGSVRPGFGAFALSTPQTVTATVNAQLFPGGAVTMRFLDSNRRQLGNSVTGMPPQTLAMSLNPGFYIVEVYNSGSSAGTYQLGLAADFFSGGVDTGGYLAPGIVGFGAFFVPEALNVSMKLFGRATYGAAGAGNMTLTLKDANRNVIQVVSAP